MYVFIDTYASNYLIRQKDEFYFLLLLLILNIIHINDENIVYMCLPSVNMILHDLYCFYLMFWM